MNGLGRRPDGENWDEPEGVGSGRSVGTGEEQRIEGGGWGEPGGGELPEGQGVVEEVSGGRGQRVEASRSGTSERASQAGEVSSAGGEAGGGEVGGRRGRAVWADTGGGTFGEGRRVANGCGNAAAMGAGGRG